MTATIRAPRMVSLDAPAPTRHPSHLKASSLRGWLTDDAYAAAVDARLAQFAAPRVPEFSDDELAVAS